MGMNYYLVRKCPHACEHCSLENEHIGKSSGGWKFTFAGVTDRKSWDDWKRDLEAGEIINEYDKPISFVDFMNLVNARKHLKSHHEYCLDKNWSHTWVDKYNNDFSGVEFS